MSTSITTTAIIGDGMAPPIPVSPAPAGLTTVDQYLALVPSQHRKPKFMAELSLLLQACIDAQNSAIGLISLFDLDTATGVQLDMVGLWIGRSRRIQVPITGFFSWNITGLGWNQSIWHGPFVPLTGWTNLDDDTYRNVLRAKVVLNRWDGSLSMLYTAFDALFVGFPGTTYVITDNMDMTMTITLGGVQPSTSVLTIVRSKILPFAPHGVTVTVVDPW